MLILSEELCQAVCNLQDRKKKYLIAEPALIGMLPGIA